MHYSGIRHVCCDRDAPYANCEALSSVKSLRSGTKLYEAIEPLLQGTIAKDDLRYIQTTLLFLFFTLTIWSYLLGTPAIDSNGNDSLKEIVYQNQRVTSWPMGCNYIEISRETECGLVVSSVGKPRMSDLCRKPKRAKPIETRVM